jgi:hypothetical protein
MIEFGKFSYFWLDTWVLVLCNRLILMINRVAKKGINSGK